MATKLDVKLLLRSYNCPNDGAPLSAPEESRLDSVDAIRVTHAARREQVGRRIFLTDFAAHEAFLTGPGRNRVNAHLGDQLRTPVWRC
ncbi:MAG: hypothetical protein ACREC9_11080 [Methylocella sp.]